MSHSASTLRLGTFLAQPFPSGRRGRCAFWSSTEAWFCPRWCGGWHPKTSASKKYRASRTRWRFSPPTPPMLSSPTWVRRIFPGRSSSPSARTTTRKSRYCLSPASIAEPQDAGLDGLNQSAIFLTKPYSLEDLQKAIRLLVQVGGEEPHSPRSSVGLTPNASQIVPRVPHLNHRIWQYLQIPACEISHNLGTRTGEYSPPSADSRSAACNGCLGPRLRLATRDASKRPIRFSVSHCRSVTWHSSPESDYDERIDRN